MTSREHRWLARRVCLGASTMIASSRFAGRLVETLGVPQTRIRVIHPGVDGSRFTGRVPRPVAHLEMPPEASPVLLSVGRLQRRKGHDTTIQAVALLGRHFPHLQYLIAGDGQERNRLEDLARASGIASRVAFLGEVPSEDLPGLYAACDIFVMPSRTDDHDVEGFGIVFLEAAAAGRPTIGGLSGGVPEAIADGETGLLVNGENPEALAEAIRTLAISPDLCARMGAAGRTRVLKSFTWERAAAELQALHDELSAESPV
jgi:phosphatidylinositol alpha-1,6-mannosyltransferase